MVAILLAAIEGLMQGLTLEQLTAHASDVVGGLAPAERAGTPKLIGDLRRPASPFVALFR